MRKFAISLVLAGAALGLGACNDTTENKTVAVETTVENDTANTSDLAVDNATANATDAVAANEQGNSADKSGPRERTTPTEK
jgi:hypothetical protein